MRSKSGGLQWEEEQQSAASRLVDEEEEAAQLRARSREIPARYRDGQRELSRAQWAVFVCIAVSLLLTIILSTVGVQPFARLQHHFERNKEGEPIFVDRDDVSELVDIRPLRVGEERPRAAMVILARNEDLAGVLLSMTRLEARFNNTQYRYPFVFLNNGHFSDEFKAATSAVTAAATIYGEIPREHWSYPAWVPQDTAAAARRRMERDGVLYGGLESYHHMCRYFSGFFHHHPLLADYDYYWRIEPDVHYFCNIDYDVFLYMRQKGIKYGFTITVLEGPATIPTLWVETQRFMRARPELIPAHNMLDFVTTHGGDYNLCHFWSNFELGDLRFFRSKAYEEYFQALDQTGGFFYERWGDAPVHSLGAVMFLNSTEIHHFGDIGYRHNSFNNCPAKLRNHCDCDAMKSVDFHSPLNSFGQCHTLWKEVLRKEELALR